MGKGLLHKRIAALVLVAIMITCITAPAAVSADATLTHGTSDTIITEDMLDTEVPSDYTQDSSGFVMSGEMVKQLIIFLAVAAAAVVVVFSLKSKQSKKPGGSTDKNDTADSK